VVAVDCDEAGLSDNWAGVDAVRPWVADMAADDVESVAASIVGELGPVELVVNNVGVDLGGSFLQADAAELDLTLATNLRGPWLFTRRLVADLIERGSGGSIVFISSLHDHIVRTHPHYSASKAAVAMLVRELAHELGPHGIRVNAVSPGAIHTRAVPVAAAEDPERVRRLVPLGRIGAPADIAPMVAVLLSDEWSGYVTGANVPVDGGLGLYTWSADE
jgi:NAD(P)-dependent dehydrogenase (short-subunit alcohol dehydrogenase family)